MELSGVILVLVLVVIFRKMLGKIAHFTNVAVSAELLEEEKEYIKQAKESYDDLIEEVGEDFRSPTELFDMVNSRSKRMRASQNKSMTLSELAALDGDKLQALVDQLNKNKKQ